MERLGLSDESRAELAALLADEAGFTAAYPAVADYLRTAPGLPGTGDDAVDHAFDLRLLYHMTIGESDDPYWAIVGPSVTQGPPERGRRREVNGGNPRGSGRLAYAQTVLQSAYAYAIPSPETTGWVAEVCGGRPLVEIGAGRGYWAHQLDRVGVHVVAYDLHEPGDGNPWFGHSGARRSTWHDVRPMGDLDQLMDRDQVLLLCWPPAWGDPMASSALVAYERMGGDRLIYVGEHRGGKSGDDAFFDALAERWELLSTDTAFVSWWNLADVAECWART
jgi:hypothetical protein